MFEGLEYFWAKATKVSKIKNKTNKFLNDISETSNFVVFTETWSERGDPDSFNWNEDLEKEIREYGSRHSKRGRSSSGGISLCAKKKPARDYKILLSDPYGIWLKINKPMYNAEEDIIVRILYILPSNSSWSKTVNLLVSIN